MTVNPCQGWQVVVAADSRLSQTEAGRFSFPVLIRNNGDDVSQAALVFTGGEIERLYTTMNRLRAGAVPTQLPSRDEELDL